MNQERLVIYERASKVCEQSPLVVSVVAILGDTVTLVVGRPGLPNLKQALWVGDAVLYETPEGLFEARILSHDARSADLLITAVAPGSGLAAGFVDQDASNAPFTVEEIRRIRTGLEEVRTAIAAGSDLSAEQFGLISRKLDYMADASERFGRKDWINLAAGTLTGAIFQAAVSPAAAKALFLATQQALSWLFGAGFHVLP